MIQDTPTQNAKKSTELPHELIVSGGSDDLINIYGDKKVQTTVSHTDELYLMFNSGAVLKMWYSERGTWNIEIINEGNGTVHHSKVGDYTGNKPVSKHSEVVTIKNDQSWMAIDGALVDFTEPPSESGVYTPETGPFTPM